MILSVLRFLTWSYLPSNHGFSYFFSSICRLFVTSHEPLRRYYLSVAVSKKTHMPQIPYTCRVQTAVVCQNLKPIINRKFSAGAQERCSSHSFCQVQTSSVSLTGCACFSQSSIYIKQCVQIDFFISSVALLKKNAFKNNIIFFTI